MPAVRVAGLWVGLVGVVVVAAVGAVVWFTGHRTAALVVPAKSVAAKAAPAVSLQGVVRAQHTIAVPAPAGGRIDGFYAEVNQEVAAGQLLARVGGAAVDANRENAARGLSVAKARVAELDGRRNAVRLEASRSRTEADHAKQEAERLQQIYKRQTLLQAAGATPRLVFEKAEKDYQSQQSAADALEDLARRAEAAVEELEEEFESAKKLAVEKQQQAEAAESALMASEIRAPAAGLIVGRRGEVGKAVAANERSDLFLIAVDLNLLQVAFPAGAGVQVGQPVLISMPELQIARIPAQVVNVAAGEAIAPFLSPSVGIRPGMPCVVSPGVK